MPLSVLGALYKTVEQHKQEPQLPRERLSQEISRSNHQSQEYFNKKAHRIEVVNHEAASLCPEAEASPNASTELSSILSILSAIFPGTSLDVRLVNVYEQ